MQNLHVASSMLSLALASRQIRATLHYITLVLSDITVTICSLPMSMLSLTMRCPLIRAKLPYIHVTGLTSLRLPVPCLRMQKPICSLPVSILSLTMTCPLIRAASHSMYCPGVTVIIMPGVSVSDIIICHPLSLSNPSTILRECIFSFSVRICCDISGKRKINPLHSLSILKVNN